MDIKKSIVRILDANGKTKGTGFLVYGTNLIATCSHVIQPVSEQPNIQQMSKPNNATQPPAQVKFVFEVDPEHVQMATIDFENGWYPWGKDDIAILEFNDSLPRDVVGVKLGESAGTQGDTNVYTHGYEINKKGLESSGSMEVADTNYAPSDISQKPIIQLTAANYIDHGFSGAPLYHPDRRRVIGMISAQSGDTGSKKALAIPSEILRESHPSLRLNDICPYPGLATFEEKDSEFFFEQDDISKKLADKLRDNPRFLEVHGPSGSGKSSLVRAGLIPELRKRWEWLQPSNKIPEYPFIIRPTDEKKGDIFSQLVSKVPKDIDGSDLVQFANTFLEQYSDYARFILIVDQFEELFTDTPESVREVFIEQLVQLLESELDVTIMLILRDDFTPVRNVKAPKLIEWINDNHSVPYILQDIIEEKQIELIIEEPVSKLGLSIEENLTQIIIDDIKGYASNSNENGDHSLVRSRILPLLAFTLKQLWEKRVDGELRISAYQDLGGISGSLPSKAEATWHDITTKNQVDENLIKRIFLDLVHVGDSDDNHSTRRDTRRRRRVKDLRRNPSEKSSVANILEVFMANRLLVIEKNQDDEQVVEIIHEVLLKNWARLQEWIENEKECRLWIQDVGRRAKDWEVGKGDLLGERTLETGEKCIDTYELHLSTPGFHNEIDNDTTRIIGYISESKKTLDQRREQERKRLEQEEKDRRRVKLFGIIVGIVVIVLMATGIGYLSYIQFDVKPRARGESVTIDAGSALLGSANGSVYIEGFIIDIHEVTNRLFKLCIKYGPCNEPPVSVDTIPFGERDPNLPVVQINAYNAATFCNWIGRRLPSVVEWERAARGQSGRNWPWEDNVLPDLERVNVRNVSITLPETTNLPPTATPDSEIPLPEPDAQDNQSNDSPDQGFIEALLSPVNSDNYNLGNSPEGIRYLVGNVREWTSTPITCEDPYICGEGELWDGETPNIVGLYIKGYSYLDTIYDENILIESNHAHPNEDIPRDQGFRCARSN